MKSLIDRAEDLRSVVAHLQIATGAALLSVPGGTVKLAVVAVAADGSGKLSAMFECAEFLADVDALAEHYAEPK